MAGQLGFAAGIAVLNGFLFLITGHAILSPTDFAVYDESSIHSSMRVGATGGVIMFPSPAIFQAATENCLGIRDLEEEHLLFHSVARNMFSLGMNTAAGAAAGGVGSKLLSLMESTY